MGATAPTEFRMYVIEGLYMDLREEITALRRGIKQRDKVIDELRQKLGWTEGQMYLFTDAYFRPENTN